MCVNQVLSHTVEDEGHWSSSLLFYSSHIPMLIKNDEAKALHASFIHESYWNLFSLFLQHQSLLISENMGCFKLEGTCKAT